MHEYAQFAGIIKKLLAYRHQKHAQLELTQDTLETKKAQLEELEKSEREANRLAEALGQGRVTGIHRANGASAPETLSTSPSQTRSDEDSQNGTSDGVPNGTDEDERERPPVYTPPHPVVAPPTRRSAPGMGFLNALSYTLHGMMDVDPETARRSGISKTRETISQVRGSLVA